MPYNGALTVADVLTNFNGPNYHGLLHKASPEETPFKALINGIQADTGGGSVIVGDMTGRHREFEWQFYSLREPSATRQRIDGFKHLSAENRIREQVKNVIQTHTESYEVAFERMAQTEQFDGINANQGPNPVTDELGWQGVQALTQVNLDQELSLLYSTYNLPVDNTTAARTRGIDEAIVTNVTDAGGDPLKWSTLVSAMKGAVEVSGKKIGEGLVAMMNTDAMEQISAEFAAKNLEPRDRMIYGVAVQTVVTPFGPLNFLYNRHVKQGEVFGVNPTSLRTWHRFVPPHDDVPGGITFTYTLARAGNATEKAIYSSVGLEYGLEKHHFKIQGLETSGS